MYHFSLNTIDQQYTLLALFKFKFRFINGPILYTIETHLDLFSVQNEEKMRKMLLEREQKNRKNDNYLHHLDSCN